MDEIGWLTLEWHGENGTPPVRFRNTDPRVWVTAQFLNNLDADDLKCYLTLDGDVLTIRDDYGQRYIYRIRWDDYADGGYLAEWPD